MRIPSGWVIRYNHFLELPTEDFVDDSFPYWMDLNEDLLHLSCDYRGRIIDLGWYPSGKAEGRYTVKVIASVDDSEQQSSNWQKPIIEYSSRSISVIQGQINDLLSKVTIGQL
ncbi:hypothetical protein ACFQI7_10215 [Paenibacillus allorhizosphaerae]|uniref:hypothetical protein n=1 Tax=Paenibacillus allorhizosphaerae TaxID=2849866 RepID=UPI001C404A5A|nr:hypothetical protein [Paenibacillus allorhizosphaerae]